MAFLDSANSLVPVPRPGCGWSHARFGLAIPGVIQDGPSGGYNLLCVLVVDNFSACLFVVHGT